MYSCESHLQEAIAVMVSISHVDHVEVGFAEFHNQQVTRIVRGVIDG